MVLCRACKQPFDSASSYGTATLCPRCSTTGSNPDALIAVFDQMGQTAENVARVLGQYHCGLISSGMPQDGALELVRDFAQQWWESALSQMSRTP